MGSVETRILDEFPPWSIYVVALVVACGFCLSVLILLRARTRPADKHSMSPARRRPISTPLIFLIVTTLAGSYLITAMFYRFHAIGIERNRISLIYLWPKSAEIIDKADLLGVSLVRSARPCGHMEIATQKAVFLSISFPHCTVANEVLKEIGTGRQ
jgi:hypothetical protein